MRVNLITLCYGPDGSVPHAELREYFPSTETESLIASRLDSRLDSMSMAAKVSNFAAVLAATPGPLWVVVAMLNGSWSSEVSLAQRLIQHGQVSRDSGWLSVRSVSKEPSTLNGRG